VLFSCENPGQKILLQQLRRLISLFDCALDGSGHDPAHLHFEDLFAARVATLLLPELVSNDSQDGHPLDLVSVKSRFDELIEYIHANPSLPLSLSDLSVQSGLSRDQLNQCFQHHFGMGPMRWIREQRIQHFNQMLDH
jgi:transcriptional regulator GlxA family with amidase domain